jgi:hypothetical protein
MSWCLRLSGLLFGAFILIVFCKVSILALSLSTSVGQSTNNLRLHQTKKEPGWYTVSLGNFLPTADLVLQHLDGSRERKEASDHSRSISSTNSLVPDPDVEESEELNFNSVEALDGNCDPACIE